MAEEMTLFEHINELRARIVRVAIAVIAMMMFSMTFSLQGFEYADAMNRLLVKRRAVAVPEHPKVLVFALHALDVPVVGLLCRVRRIHEIGYAKTPVPDAHRLRVWRGI